MTRAVRCSRAARVVVAAVGRDPGERPTAAADAAEPRLGSPSRTHGHRHAAVGSLWHRRRSAAPGTGHTALGAGQTARYACHRSAHDMNPSPAR
jgi:hypothetical protein